MSDLSSRSEIGKTGIDVSKLCLGTMQIGWLLDEEASNVLLDSFVDFGGNFIDTANMYGGDQNLGSYELNKSKCGLTESIIGRWMKSRKNRNDLVIATKIRARVWDGPDGEGLGRNHVPKAVDDCLERLGVDQIDILLAHFPDGTDFFEVFEVFNSLISSGKVRTIGSSNFPASMMEDALAVSSSNGFASWTSVQPRYSLLNRSEYEDGLMQFAIKENLGVFPFSPLAGGFLTGKYRSAQSESQSVRSGFSKQYQTEKGFKLIECMDNIAKNHNVSLAAVAISWVLSRPQVVSAVVGANSVSQLADQIPGASIKLEQHEVNMLESLAWNESQGEFLTW